jgi:hypothetical protein
VPDRLAPYLPVLVALLLFVLAGLTGALYRFGIAYGMTGGLSLENIRHAHSHLMYMGWVTPVLFILIAAALGRGERSHERALRVVVGASLVAAMLTYPLFLLFGYRPIAIGTTMLPPAVIASGLNILTWYGFVAVWRLHRRSLSPSPGLELIDGSLILMVLATAGAWGLALQSPLGLDNPLWPEALKHLFLDLFSEGWFVLATLGVMYRTLDVPADGAVAIAGRALIASVPLTFLIGMPVSHLSPLAQAVGAVAGVVAAGATMAHVVILWRVARRSWAWNVVLSLLALKAIALGVVSLAPSWSFAGMAGLRVLYLHIAFLGFVTLGLMMQAVPLLKIPSGNVFVTAFFVTAGLLLFTLLPLSGLWPGTPTGRWPSILAAWTSLGPPVTVGTIALAAIHARVFSTARQH